MSDAVDIKMDDVIAQYREECTKLMEEKLLLQAAVKIMGEKLTELTDQVHQLTVDISTSIESNQRLTESLDAARAVAEPLEEELPLMVRPVPLSPEHHIPYTHGGNDSGE